MWWVSVCRIKVEQTLCLFPVDTYPPPPHPAPHFIQKCLLPPIPTNYLCFTWPWCNLQSYKWTIWGNSVLMGGKLYLRLNRLSVSRQSRQCEELWYSKQSFCPQHRLRPSLLFICAVRCVLLPNMPTFIDTCWLQLPLNALSNTFSSRDLAHRDGGAHRRTRCRYIWLNTRKENFTWSPGWRSHQREAGPDLQASSHSIYCELVLQLVEINQM